MRFSDFYNNELSEIKLEIRNFKRNQLTILFTTVSAAGLLLGLATSLTQMKNLNLEQNGNLIAIAFLAPLIVIIPFCHFFFENIRSMAQAVGYCRVMENINLGLIYASKYHGWENAIGIFRGDKEQWHKDVESDSTKTQSRKASLFKPEHPFWQLSYFTFFGLSIVCVSVSISFLDKYGTTWGWVILLFFTVALLISVYLTFRTIRSLIKGNDTIDHYEAVWRKVLEVSRTRRRGEDRRLSFHLNNWPGPERRYHNERRTV
jgi:hypothetical protein